MWGCLLPLWVEIVGADIPRDDNEGASCGGRGGGWTTKKTRCSELEYLRFRGSGGGIYGTRGVPRTHRGAAMTPH